MSEYTLDQITEAGLLLQKAKFIPAPGNQNGVYVVLHNKMPHVSADLDEVKEMLLYTISTG